MPNIDINCVITSALDGMISAVTKDSVKREIMCYILYLPTTNSRSSDGLVRYSSQHVCIVNGTSCTLSNVVNIPLHIS